MERQRHPSVDRPLRRAPSVVRYSSHRPHVHVAGLSGLESLRREIRARWIFRMHLGAETATHDRVVIALDDIGSMRAIAAARGWIFNDRAQLHHRAVVVNSLQPAGLSGRGIG